MRRKSPKQREEIGSEKLKLYFEDSGMQIINCEVLPDFTRRIVGLYTGERFLGLGIAEAGGSGGLKVMTPVGTKVDKIEYSAVKFGEVS